MAENIAESANKQHNAGARKEGITKAMTETCSLDDQIEAAMEKHVTPLREAKKDIKKRMRDDFDISTKMFNARYATFRIEHKAKANGDDKILDTLSELYGVMPVGDQLDWVSAASPAEAA